MQGQTAGAVAAETYVWLDLFAMNQHASEESGADLGDLRGNLEKAVSAWGWAVSHDAVCRHELQSCQLLLASMDCIIMRTLTKHECYACVCGACAELPAGAHELHMMTLLA